MTTSAQTQRLITVQERPYNAETPLSALAQPITPAELFYIRSNFDLPVLDRAQWRLSIDGGVGAPCTLSLADLEALPPRTITTTVECAGNGRKLMAPVPAGTAWNLGAVSTGTFSGVALKDVLQLCDYDPYCAEILFEGADRGTVSGDRFIPFARSLPLARALHEDTIIAWELNGAPLAPDHGYPVRLIVPGYYGVASVKWLIGITALKEPFIGHFQNERYVYIGQPGVPDGTPVTGMLVRALITTPAAGESVNGATHVRGIAWSGYGAIERVSVSVDGGATWQDATVHAPVSPYAASSWELPWVPAHPGEHEIVARATDSQGNVQPLESVWNSLGYGNNVVHRVLVGS